VEIIKAVPLGQGFQQAHPANRAGAFREEIALRAGQPEPRIRPAEKRLVSGLVQGRGIERQIREWLAVANQRGLEKEQRQGTVGQDYAPLRGQGFLHQRKISQPGIAVDCPDLRQVAVKQQAWNNQQQEPDAGGCRRRQFFERPSRQAIGVARAKDQQKIPAEIANAQCPQIIQRKKGKSQTTVPRADRAIQRHPNTGQQPCCVNEVKYASNRQGLGAATVRLKAQRPAAYAHEKGRQYRSQA